MEWLSEHAWAVWLALAMLLAIGELATLDLVLLMLAAGAGVGMLAALAGLGEVAQVLLASATAVATLALLRPKLLQRLHSSPELRLGARNIVGQQALVVHEMDGSHAGQIKIAGETWAALPYDESTRIPHGAVVDILEIRGATAYVLPIPQLNTQDG